MNTTPDGEPETKETEEIDKKLAELASIAKLRARDKSKFKTIDELLKETQKNV
jgi:hypothetical protein